MQKQKKVGTTTVCLVSSNPQHNIGHCRSNPQGGDKCFRDGAGPACVSTVEVTIPDPILPGNG